MRSLPFIKFAPGGNTTVLIPNISLTAQERAQAASEMLGELHLGAEQVGYVQTGGLPRLTMMGGEFCVNATRCVAVFLAMSGLLTPDVRSGWQYGEVRVSGRDEPLRVRARGGQGVYEAGARLTGKPLVDALETGVWRVSMPGIVHLVLDAAQHTVPASTDDRKRLSDDWLERYGLKQADASGVIWMDAERIVPVVWVRHTASLCAETACGSGTLAAACVGLTQCPERREWRFAQPSGDSLAVTLAETASEPWQVWINGPVRVVAEGTVRVWCLEDLQSSDV